MLRNQHAAHSTKKVARKSLHCWAATLTTVPEIGLAVKPCAAQVCHIAARLTHHQLFASMAAVAPIAAEASSDPMLTMELLRVRKALVLGDVEAVADRIRQRLLEPLVHCLCIAIMIRAYLVVRRHPLPCDLLETERRRREIPCDGLELLDNLPGGRRHDLQDGTLLSVHMSTCIHAQHAISCDNTLYSDTDAYFVSAAMLLITTKVSSMIVVAGEANNLKARPLGCSRDETSLSDVFSGQS